MRISDWSSDVCSSYLDPRVKVETVPNRLFTGRAIAKALAAFAPDVVHCHLRRATRIVARTQPPAALVATLHIDFNSPVDGAMDGLICNARWQLERIPAGYNGLVLKANNSLQPHRRLDAGEIAGLRREFDCVPPAFLIGGAGRRSEEHTSALQSLMRNSYAVFCLKKKKTSAYRHPDQHCE